MADIFGGKSVRRAPGEAGTGARLTTLVSYKQRATTDASVTSPASNRGAGASASAATAMADQRREIRKNQSLQEKIAASLGKSKDHTENTAEATSQLVKDTRRNRALDEQRRQITQTREVKQRRQVIASWKKTNDLLKKIADAGVGAMPWNRKGGVLGAAGNILKWGGLGALMGAQGLTALAKRVPVLGPALKKLPAGFKPTSQIPKTNVLGRIGNIGGRLAVGGLGAALGVVGLKQGYDSLRAKQGQSFFGQGEGEGGLLDSRASDYLLNAGTGALTGAAIGSAIPVVGTAVGAVVGGLTGVITSVYADFKEQIDGWFASVGDFIKNADWKKIGMMAGDAVKAFAGMIWEGLKQVPGILWDVGKNIVGFIGEWGPEIFAAGWGFIIGVVDSLTGGFGTWLTEGLANTGKWIAGKAGEVGAWMAGIGQAIWDWVGGLLDAAWELIPGQSKEEQGKNLFKDIVDNKGGIEEKKAHVLKAARDKAMSDIAASESILAKFNDMKAAGTLTPEQDKARVILQTNLADAYRVVRTIDDEINRRAGVNIVPTGPTSAGHNILGAMSPQTAAGVKANAQTMVYNTATNLGIDPNYAKVIVGRESSFDPYAQNSKSSAGGLYQFIDSTWNEMFAKYGEKYNLVNDKYDARSNAILGALFTKENKDYLEKYLKRPVTNQELYYAHFLGKEGAYKFIKGLTANAGAQFDIGMSTGDVLKYNPQLKAGSTFADVRDYLGISALSPSKVSENISSITPAKPNAVGAAEIPLRPSSAPVQVTVASPPAPKLTPPTPAPPPRMNPADVPMDDVGLASMNLAGAF